eukprot:TRINITY_DN21037_c0_g1_i1.p1 TRINITY_DN21037_c0_g1~~TRINITY_DN21037_c0_g1_i1.p1  ORF type:complete len:1431 (-),score=138.73 TRINITY_DN21037_c0_g1_i1:187-3840(-)
MESSLGIAVMVMIQWVFAEYAWIQFIKCDLRWQAGAVHLVFRKSLYLPVAGSGYTLGQLQNLFSTDCSKASSNFLHTSFTSLLETLVSLTVVVWHLCALTGSAGLVGMVVIALFAPITFILTKSVKSFVQKQQAARDARGRLFNQFISAMRVVKCFQLEEVAWQQITEARRAELKWQWRKRLIFPFNNFIGATASLFGTAATFAWLVVVLEKPLDPAVAFTVLSWNNLLKSKMFVVPNACVNILDTYVSIKRVEKLLHSHSGEDSTWLEPLPDDGTRSASDSSRRLELQCKPSASSPPLSEHADHGSRQELTDYSLVDCDFGYPSGQQHKGIRGLSLRVHPGELLLVCGPIGSGKTTLLQGCAGVMKPLRGVCEIRGRSTAYVAQRPWLLNGSLLENITFGQPTDDEKLSRILKCCSLGPDLQVLGNGLDTLVGEEGVQLSGGQKQRVSLARAIYSEADVVIMDDVLSALDAHVGQHIWEEAICGSLRGRTRILATHQVHYCSDSAVDRILILDDDGRVQHLGTYEELLKQGVQFGSLQRSVGGDTETTQESVGGTEKSEAAGSVRTVPETLAADPTSATSRNGTASQRHGASELRRLGAVQGQDFLEYLRACGGAAAVSIIVILLVAYYGTVLASNFQLAAWANWSSRQAAGGSASIQSQSKSFLEVYIFLSLTTGVLCIFFFLGIQLVSLRSSRVLHERFARSLLWAELRFFDVTPTGRILNRCLKDFQLLDDRMPAAFRELIESLMNFIIAAAILFLFAWEALLAVPLFGFIYWRVMNVYRWPARDMKRLESLSRSPIMSHFSDATRGSCTIRAYRQDARFMHDNLVLMGDVQRTSYWFQTCQGWVSMVQEFLGTLLLAIIAGSIGYRAYTGYLSPGLAGLAMSYAINMPRDLMWLSRRIASMEVEFVSIERILEYVRLTLEQDVHERNADGLVLPVEGYAIHAEAVWLRYAPEFPWVLRGLSLKIPKGSRAALVGRTGCGKSSLLSALARLYPIAAGCLFVNGKDVMGTSLRELRRVVRVLLQDPIFFSGSIRSNLLCRTPKQCMLDNVERTNASSESAEDAALWQALGKAGIEKLIRDLPSGLDEPVEEGGQNFSHGERQLLCLARVLVDVQDFGQDAIAQVDAERLLLCDEPTSSCDLATDEHIHGTLLHGLPEHWTVAVVCHRLHRIREFDMVYVLEEGQVAEQGAPATLLEASSRSGVLAGMCQQQGVI